MSDMQIADLKREWDDLSKEKDRTEGMFRITGCRFRKGNWLLGSMCTHERHIHAKSKAIRAECTIKRCPI